MPTPIPPRFSLVTAEPREAVAMYQRRGLLAPTFRWDDLWQAEHSRAFMVAGVAQADVLRLFSAELQRSLAAGGSLADFAAAVKPQLQRKGWWGDVEITDPQTGEIRTTRFDDSRLRLIYDTNLRQSYAAGRWARAQRNKRRKPLLVYRTMRDERVRATHARWDGVALPVDHPFWATHYPPNGWRCRCRAFAASETDLQRLRDDGVAITTDAPEVQYTEVRTRTDGPVHRVPVGIDPGWAYNPGASSIAQAGELQRNALAQLPQPLAAATTRQAVRSRMFERLVTEPVPALEMAVAVRARAGGAAASVPVVLRGDDLAGNANLPGNPAHYARVQDVLDAGRQVAETRTTRTLLLVRGGMAVLVELLRDVGRDRLVRLRVLPLADAARDAELGPLLTGQGGGTAGGGT